MSRLHEPLQDHIHSKMCNSINEAIIAIKLHHIDLSGESAEQQAKIMDVRKRHHMPTWPEIVELLTQARDEMDECKQPFKRY